MRGALLVGLGSELRWCVGGRAGRPCVSFGRHLTEGCPDANLAKDEPPRCRGCLPRRATDGWLCQTCDTYLRQWLDVTRTRDGEWRTGSVLWVHAWLGLSQSSRITRAPRSNPVRSEREDLPSPLSEAILDCRQLMADRVLIAEERARGEFDEGPLADVRPFSLVDGVAYLAGKLLRIEDDRDLVRWLYVKLDESMNMAHALAPWRAKPEFIRGIPCPHCERMSLWIEGGDDFATCRTCGCTVVSQRFDQWVAMLHHERGA